MEKPGDLIDLEKLICFTQVAEFGGFARASAILRKPQRVLSRNVRQLEDHLGIELLVRLENGIALTGWPEVTRTWQRYSAKCLWSYP